MNYTEAEGNRMVARLISGICEATTRSFEEVLMSVENILKSDVLIRDPRVINSVTSLEYQSFPRFMLSDQDKADLDVIRRIRRGSIKKSVCRDYAIYNGDWYRDHPWNVPKEHEPHILAPDEFGECGVGWLEHWCSIEDDSGEQHSEVFFERCAWCGKTLTTNEFLVNLEPGDNGVPSFFLTGSPFFP